MENTYDDIEDYKSVVDDIESDMWGCFGWVAVFGLILLLITFLIAKS